MHLPAFRQADLDLQVGHVFIKKKILPIERAGRKPAAPIIPGVKGVPWLGTPVILFRFTAKVPPIPIINGL